MLAASLLAWGHGMNAIHHEATVVVMKELIYM